MTTDDDFRALDAQLSALGLRNGSDYRIQGVPMPGLSSGEYIGLRIVEGSFEVFSYDAGTMISLLVTTDFVAARERLTAEAIDLGAAHRRGPKATSPDPSTPWNEALGQVTHAPPETDR